MIERYQPDVVVFEDYRGEGSRRANRVEDLLDAIAEFAREQKIATSNYSRKRIRENFSAYGAVTKYEIAKAIAQEIPDFAPRLPGERKIWLPEHPNMSIFDAASLALTHFAIIVTRENRGASASVGAAVAV